MIRPLSCASLTAILMTATPIAASAHAAEPAPRAGLVHIRSTPCLAAKHGKGEKCELPPLPENESVRERVAARMSRAQHFIDIAELQNALSEADAALALDPTNVDVRHLVARLALSTGNFARGEREIKTAIEQRPEDVDLRATNAVRIKNLAWLEEALHEFDDILTKRPDHRFSRDERATLLMSLGRPDEAVADLNILLADRQDASLLARRGTAHLAMNDAPQSIADFSAALKESPGRFDLLTGRAMAYEVNGDDQGALADYDAILGPIGGPSKIAMTGDQLAKYYMQRAQVLLRLKRFSDAAVETMSAISAGGRRSVLRAQVYLRRHGFPDTPLDGQDSPSLRAALKSCFGLNSCFENISSTL